MNGNVWVPLSLAHQNRAVSNNVVNPESFVASHLLAYLKALTLSEVTNLLAPLAG